MKRIRTLTAMAAASLLACAIHQSASAALVPIAANTPALPIAGATFSTAGLTLATSQAPFAIGTALWTGTFAADVYYNSGSSGPLTFVYTIHQTTGDPRDPIQHLSVS